MNRFRKQINILLILTIQYVVKLYYYYKFSEGNIDFDIIIEKKIKYYFPQFYIFKMGKNKIFNHKAVQNIKYYNKVYN